MERRLESYFRTLGFTDDKKSTDLMVFSKLIKDGVTVNYYFNKKRLSLTRRLDSYGKTYVKTFIVTTIEDINKVILG